MRRHLLVYEMEKDYIEKISSSFVTEKFQVIKVAKNYFLD